MHLDHQKLRLDGIYRQNNAGQFMLRVKLPCGILSASQAEDLCDLADSFSNGYLHLTCRGSVELHWLETDHISEILRRLATVGLTTRGACGGAVRGVSCSTGLGPGFNIAQRVAHNLHQYFTGNAHFEGLPKKFKIGVDTGYEGARHLIQDLGIVCTGHEDGEERFDIWCGGGLGREPQAGFLLKENVLESEILPLAETVVRIYARHAPPGKRLKHVVRSLGQNRLTELVNKCYIPPLNKQYPLSGNLTSKTNFSLEIPIFAGEVSTVHLHRIASTARNLGDSVLMVTANQDLRIFLPNEPAMNLARHELNVDIISKSTENSAACRICPGNHECRMGLSPTREIARQLLATLGQTGKAMTWAIAGCPNSCSQPQLADAGILTTGLDRASDGTSMPRFTLYRRQGHGLGAQVATDLNLLGLLDKVRDLN